MSRQTIFLAACAAVSLCCVTVSVAVLQGSRQSPQSPDLAYAVQGIEARLDDMESRWNTRLNEIERESSGMPRLGGEDTEGGGERFVTATGEGGDGEAGDLGGENGIEKLVVRLDEFETRLRGLEEDPVERGYTYLSSSSSELRRQGIFTLERIAKHDPQARGAIRQMLADDDSRVRLAALDTLADLGDKESASEIVTLLGDSNPSVRRETVETLARLGAQQAGGQIAAMLSDPEVAVRERAADVLGRLRYKGGAEYLMNALTDSNDEVRGQAIASLGEIGYKEAAPALRQLYEKEPGRQRFRLIMALKSLGDTQPLQQEVQRMSKAALADPSDDARRRAIRTLAWFARDQSKEVFQRAMQDPSERVRREAARAIQQGKDRRKR